MSLGCHVVQVYPIKDGRCSCGKADCGSPGKHPIGGDTRATTDPATIRSWWAERPNANVGVNLHLSGLVDVSSDSHAALVDFRARGLPTTARFESGSGPGHEHTLYRRPEDCPVTRDCRSGVLDLMSSGIAVLPPSVSGRGAYRWLNRLETPVEALPVAPAWVSAELSRQAMTDSRYAVDPDQPPVPLRRDALERWHGRLPKLLPAGGIDESGSLVAIANDLARERLTANGVSMAVQERARALGYGKYETRTDREVRYAEIAGSAVERYGSKTGSDAGQFELIDFADVRNLPRPVWLVEGVLVENTIATLFGPSGTGKTFVAVDLAMSVALGRDWHGRKLVQGPVVYIACEDGMGVGYRVDGWCRHHGIEPAELRGAGSLIASAANLRDPQQVAGLVAALDTLPEPPTLVVIDTLAWAMVGGDENSTKDVMEVMDAARRLHERTGCTVLIVHHTRKSDEVERGSSSLRAGSYTMLKLTGEETIRLEIDKMKGAAKGTPMGFRLVPVVMDESDDQLTVVIETTCVIESADAFAQAGQGDLFDSERRLLTAITDSFTLDEPVSYSRIQKASGVPQGKTFERSLKGLLARGYLAQDGVRKPYRLTEEGVAALSTVAPSPSPSSHRHDGGPGAPSPPPSSPSHPVGVTVDGGVTAGAEDAGRKALEPYMNAKQG